MPPRGWPWLLIATAGLMAWVFAMAGVVLGGAWLALIAPSLMCGQVAFSTWRQINPKQGRPNAV